MGDSAATSPLISWARTQNNPWIWLNSSSCDKIDHCCITFRLFLLCLYPTGVGARLFQEDQVYKNGCWCHCDAKSNKPVYRSRFRLCEFKGGCLPWERITTNSVIQVIWYLTLFSRLLHHLRAGTYTNLSLDKMASISQTAFSNAFSWMKILEFRFEFHWHMFLRVQLSLSLHWFR